MAVKIKVCGITTMEDAETALELGADMLGFNFYAPSPRAIAPEQARQIIERLPAESFNVALFVNESRENVADVIGSAKFVDGRQAYRGLQFHGEESAEYCRGWNMKIIKAFRLKGRDGVAGMNDFPADFYLLDSWTAGYGGSGETFPWEWVEGCDGAKLILSGGLRVENVAAAIRRVRPFGVDVCSGVESRPGVKDHAKLKDFIDAAKSA
jgi:phosphoribosylanthranilate isomerase